MKINDVITVLQRVKESAGGDTEVFCSSFCGTNNGFVTFDFVESNNADFIIDEKTGNHRKSLTIKVSDNSKEEIIKGIKDMESDGYRYFRSQFVEAGKEPRVGISPCEWHGLW